MLKNDKAVLNLSALKCLLKFCEDFIHLSFILRLFVSFFLCCVPFWKGIKVCLWIDVFSVCMWALFAAFEQLIGFHKTVHDCHMVGGYPSPINFNFLQSVMTKWQVGKLWDGSTTFGFWNSIWQGLSEFSVCSTWGSWRCWRFDTGHASLNSVFKSSKCKHYTAALFWGWQF